MKIKLKGKDVELKFTYNSFRYMEDLDISKLETLDTNPFRLIRTLEQLMYGALNNNPKVKYDMDVVQEYLEKCLEEGNLFKISEELMGELEKSSFFQNLQVEEQTETEKVKKK